MVDAEGGWQLDRIATTAAALRVLADLAPDRREPSFDASLGGESPIAWMGSLNSPFAEGRDVWINAEIGQVFPPR